MEQINKLRNVITENLRIQKAGAKPVQYIDVHNALNDISARQNHAIFARRGCGKTLLLHHSARTLSKDIQTVYLNCEDFKLHSFPNVLIEILDTLFLELEKHLNGWFGKQKKSRDVLTNIRAKLDALRKEEDEVTQDIVESHSKTNGDKISGSTGASLKGFRLSAEVRQHSDHKSAIEFKYAKKTAKLAKLHTWLPELKRQISDFFELSKSVKTVFLQLDDFYHLARTDQPEVMDYLHRLCKDLPLYFKIATLRHASTLYADREGQPIGAQERHDYQPINIDFTFSEFPKTLHQNRLIFHEFAKLADLEPTDIDSLFKGTGFERLVMAGGGVPRDCLSLFLEIFQTVTTEDVQIGKDDVRILSRSNFERRIEELKNDSVGNEQATLIQGIYVLRKFCIDKKSNVMMVPEEMMQQDDQIRGLLYRLLDYRIIHSGGSALTHKSATGTYHAFVIDIGCYAHLRKLQGKFTEIDVSDKGAREKMRSSPILTSEHFINLWNQVPKDAEIALKSDDEYE